VLLVLDLKHLLHALLLKSCKHLALLPRCLQVAVTARRKDEPSSSSSLNQPLPYAPVVNFDALLEASPPHDSSSGNGSHSNGDSIVQQDLVLWVASGLQHLPGSEGEQNSAACSGRLCCWQYSA
jgi:hypothetical protein